MKGRGGESDWVMQIAAKLTFNKCIPKSSSTDWFEYCDGLCIRFCGLFVLNGILLLLSNLFINLCRWLWSMKPLLPPPPLVWFMRWWLSSRFSWFNWSVRGLEFIMNWFCCCCCWFLWKSKNLDMLGWTWFMSPLWFILCCCCWEYCWLNIMRLISLCANMLSALLSSGRKHKQKAV